MESVGILSVVCNALQLFDHAWKLFTKTKIIYRSADGAGDNSQTLQTIAEEIQGLSEKIMVDDTMDDDLKRLAEMSKSIAGDLFSVVDDLRVKGKHRRWESFLVAVREAWHSDKMREFMERLKELQLHAVVVMSYKIL